MINKVVGFQVDPGVLHGFQLGIVLGIIIVTTLSIFPGKPSDDFDVVEEPSKNRTENASKLNALDFTSRTKIESGEAAFHAWTPYRKINAAMYVIIILVSAIILDHEYGGLLSFWLPIYFPRETAVFSGRVLHT